VGPAGSGFYFRPLRIERPAFALFLFAPISDSLFHTAGARAAMRLSDLLEPRLVVIPFAAADKWAAISGLAAAAVAAGRLPARMLPQVEQALLARERSMTTGMEDGIAIPHAAVDGIDDVLAVLGIASQGIAFDALDGGPARIIVCLIIPRAKKLLHIKTLAGIAKLFARAEVRERVLACRSAENVVGAIVEAEAG
jgi:mannitol/fructose-specific phosphotransferase system IIA component (Ntr-type)